LRLSTFVHDGRRQVGVVGGNTVTALDLTPTEELAGVLSLAERVHAGAPLPATRGAPIVLAEVALEAPLPRPRRNLFCVGRNYHAHAKELRESVFRNSTADAQSWPIVFTKVPETVVGPGATVRMPVHVSRQIDYEAELAIVVGRGGRDIPRERALEHVFGYTIVNDVTARDVQMRHQQWDLGKSFDGFCPMGPWIVTADELDGGNTRVRCWVNDELRQDAHTRDLIFDIATLIQTCSRGITLLPGDVIATGTAAGVGMGFTPPKWLQHGDVVRIEVDGIGTLSNPFVEEAR